MYKHILIPLENSATDQIILRHIRALAKLCEAKLLLVHVADGFVARNQANLNLAESEEMLQDTAYLERCASELRADHFTVQTSLACGEPAVEILSIAQRENCDLIAMATHGHRMLSDLLLGSVAENIRHRTEIPILMVRAPGKSA